MNTYLRVHTAGWFRWTLPPSGTYFQVVGEQIYSAGFRIRYFFLNLRCKLHRPETAFQSSVHMDTTPSPPEIFSRASITGDCRLLSGVIWPSLTHLPISGLDSFSFDPWPMIYRHYMTVCDAIESKIASSW